MFQAVNIGSALRYFVEENFISGNLPSNHVKFYSSYLPRAMQTGLHMLNAYTAVKSVQDEEGINTLSDESKVADDDAEFHPDGIEPLHIESIDTKSGEDLRSKPQSPAVSPPARSKKKRKNDFPRAGSAKDEHEGVVARTVELEVQAAAEKKGISEKQKGPSAINSTKTARAPTALPSFAPAPLPTKVERIRGVLEEKPWVLDAEYIGAYVSPEQLMGFDPTYTASSFTNSWKSDVHAVFLDLKHRQPFVVDSSGGQIAQPEGEHEAEDSSAAAESAEIDTNVFGVNRSRLGSARDFHIASDNPLFDYEIFLKERIFASAHPETRFDPNVIHIVATHGDFLRRNVFQTENRHPDNSQAYVVRYRPCECAGAKEYAEAEVLGTIGRGKTEEEQNAGEVYSYLDTVDESYFGKTETCSYRFKADIMGPSQCAVPTSGGSGESEV